MSSNTFNNSQQTPQEGGLPFPQASRPRPEAIQIPPNYSSQQSPVSRPQKTARRRQIGDETVTRMPPVEGIDDNIDDYDFDFDPSNLDLSFPGDQKILALRLEIIKAKLHLKALQAAQMLKLSPNDPTLKNPTKVAMPTNWDNDDDDVGGAAQTYPGFELGDDDSLDEDDEDGNYNYVRPSTDSQAAPAPRILPGAKSAAAQSPLPDLSQIRRFNQKAEKPNSQTSHTSRAQTAVPGARQGSSKPSPVASPASAVSGAGQSTKSFSQRLAERRMEDEKKMQLAAEKAKLKEARSKGFGLAALTPPAEPTEGETTGTPVDANPTTPATSSHFDPFTSLHLTKRLIPHPTLTRVLGPHTILTLKQLLKTVSGPLYETPQPPDIPTADYVLVGVIASKSPPREHQNRPAMALGAPEGFHPAKAASGSTNKFMVLTISDLEYDIDLYLFGDAYTRYWKLVPGTVVAILNPEVMPPRAGSNTPSKFALKLAGTFGAVDAQSGEPTDAVLEIGTARDLTWCEARKADGNLCGTWLDRRKTTICEFHLNLQVDKTRRGRMSLNTASSGRVGGPRFRSAPGSARSTGSNSSVASKASFRSQPLGRQHNSALRETLYFAPPSVTKSSAGHRTGGSGTRSGNSPAAGSGSGSASFQSDPFLGLVTDSDILTRAAAEAARKKRADKISKEREFARTLASYGTGMGKEYLQLRDGESAGADPGSGHGTAGSGSGSGKSNDKSATQPLSATASAMPPQRPVLTAESLGLIRDPASLSSPSAYKRKRAVAGSASISGGGTPRSGISNTSVAGTSTPSSRLPRHRTKEPLGWSGATKRAWLDDGDESCASADGGGGKKKKDESQRTGLVSTASGPGSPCKRSRLGDTASTAAAATAAAASVTPIRKVIETVVAAHAVAGPGDESSDDELEIV